MTNLALSLMGSFQAKIDGRLITSFRSAKIQGLLIYLAINRDEVCDRDFLAAFLWPDESERTAKKNLRQSIYQLRQTLGESAATEEPILLVTRSTLQINPNSPLSVDVEDFLSLLQGQELDRAVESYRGELLQGFSCDSLPFEEWLRSEQERLHRLSMEALFELTTRKLARADYRAAQNLAQRQLAIEPWREEAHRQLMEALALLGQRSAALAQYETCTTILQDELGVDPSAETIGLVERIRSQQFRPGKQLAKIPLIEHRRLITPFVGRKNEHATLVDAYRRTSVIGFQGVGLIGEAGIGKTRLAQKFLEWAAAQGADILRGQAFETSGSLSYQPLTQALRQRLDRVNAPEDLLSDLWLTQLTRILPELRDRYPDLPAPTRDEATARQHLFEALTRLCLALADRSPLVILLDDWHWADAASRDVLHYAALRWQEEQAPILVLMTIRKEELTESMELNNWLNRFVHDVACQKMYLQAFNQTELGQLVEMLLVPGEDSQADPDVDPASQHAGLIRWLVKESDGHPLFLVEMLKALIEDGLIRPDKGSQGWIVDWPRLTPMLLESSAPVMPRVREIIKGWLRRISAPAGQLLEAASVLGYPDSFEHICQVAGLEEIQALTYLDELLERQLLLELDVAPLTPGKDSLYTFSHQLLRELVYNEAGAARRKILHRRAFQILRDANAPAAELARHATRAGLLTDAYRYSLLAGNEAMHLFAARVAIPHYEAANALAKQMGWPEAISGADRQELYANLGRAYEIVGAWESALSIYQTMLAYARTQKAAALECLGLNRLATVRTQGFDDPQLAIELLEQARAVAEKSGDQRGLAETEWNLSISHRMKHEIEPAQQHVERALANARQLGHKQLLARCQNSLAYVHGLQRHWDLVESCATEAQRLYAASGDRILEADSQRLAGWSQMYTGRPHESLATLLETYIFSQQIENLWGLAECGWRLALTWSELGEYGKAIHAAEQAFEQANQVQQPSMILLARTALGAVQRTIQDLHSAQETLSVLLDEIPRTGLTAYEDWSLNESCAIAALAGDWDRAFVYAKRSLLFREAKSLLPMSFSVYFETEALLRGGASDLARSGVEQLGQGSRNNRRYRIAWLRSLAVLARWDQDQAQAITYLREALALVQEIGLPGEEWAIWGSLSDLFAQRGESDLAQEARASAAAILLGLANSLDRPELRSGFLAADAVRHILE